MPPATVFSVPPPRSSRRWFLAAVWLLAMAAGCDSADPSDGAAVGLVILSGDVGDTRLTVIGNAGSHQLSPPAPATAWISGSGDGSLVATLADGRVGVLRDAASATGDAAWQLVAPTTNGQPTGSLLFGSASADGRRLASLAQGAAGDFGLALTDPSTGDSVVFGLEAEPILTSPAWLDAERVAVVVADRDTAGAVSIVDPASGAIAGGPGNVEALAVSGDGLAVVWVSTVDRRLYGSNAGSWLAGQEVAALPVDAPPGTTPGAFALDGSGRRLAVVWEDEDGVVAEIAIHARTPDGWSAVRQIEAPHDDPRAVVTWLR